ncbi:MAG: type II methionyl aminopeptidase [Thermoplasmata archaeon]
MDAAELERWRAAGRIAAEARELGARRAVVGIGRRELAELIEGHIREQGAEPAFPANISRNVEAAHYTPDPGDEERLEAGDLVKIDVGAHLDGALSDTAITVEIGGGRVHENLRQAVREALAAAVAEVRPGVRVDVLSAAIEAAIHRRGLKPVRNLTGHSLERYLLHAGTAIPNVAGMSSEVLFEGEIIAIEPFATNGAGEIANGPFGNIVRFRKDPGPDPPELHALFERFRTLPFTMRWVAPPDRERLKAARRHLQTYPVFVERGGGRVSQAEHTVRVGADGPEILTGSPSE